MKTITKEDIQKAMPSRKGGVTDEIVDIINKSQTEPEFQGESLLQTATTYEKVMQNNKAGIKQYLNAIRFCSYLISLDDNYTEAYKKTFWDTEFVKNRLDKATDSSQYKELTSAASRYRKSKLVVDILTVSQVPMHLMFTGMQYQAVGVLHNVMMTAKLDRDKINAAKELLAATKAPENVKIDLDIGVKENSAVQQLNDQLAQLASRQKVHLEAGTTDLNQLGAMKVQEDIIEGEIDE